MGYDASRKVTAMGHSLLSAITVTHKRTIPLCVNLEKGRKKLPEKKILLFNEIIKSMGNKGILVYNRGFDNTVFIPHAYHSKHHSAERMKERGRDLFDTNNHPLPSPLTNLSFFPLFSIL